MSITRAGRPRLTTQRRPGTTARDEILDAEWVDVAPSDLGYWAMSIPTGEGRARRVWPFGRVLRVIAGADDDLAGYYRKLREARR